MLIKSAYDANNITLPYPIRTLGFDIKGSKNLSEMVMNIQSDPDTPLDTQ